MMFHLNRHLTLALVVAAAAPSLALAQSSGATGPRTDRAQQTERPRPGEPRTPAAQASAVLDGSVGGGNRGNTGSGSTSVTGPGNAGTTGSGSAGSTGQGMRGSTGSGSSGATVPGGAR